MLSAFFKRAFNDFELRKFNLSYLLDHEFVHNLQYATDPWLNIHGAFWKLEGHAEYIARQWKSDGAWKQKLRYLREEKPKPHSGIPVNTLDDGTVQNLDYFRYGLVVQYLVEEEQLNFQQICADSRSFDELYATVLYWDSE